MKPADQIEAIADRAVADLMAARTEHARRSRHTEPGGDDPDDDRGAGTPSASAAD